MPKEYHLKKGDKAPDFKLKVTPDQKVSLSDFKGIPVVLVFYPADFSPVCGDEIALFNQALPLFEKHRAQLLGISVDNVWSHLAFAKERNIHFPLLSDFHPKGAVAKEYNVYREDEGLAERALFLINGNGAISWSYVSPVGINPGVDGVLKVLRDLEKT